MRMVWIRQELLMYLIGVIIVTIAYVALYYVITLNSFFDGVDVETLKKNTFIKQEMFLVVLSDVHMGACNREYLKEIISFIFLFLTVYISPDTLNWSNFPILRAGSHAERATVNPLTKTIKINAFPDISKDTAVVLIKPIP